MSAGHNNDNNFMPGREYEGRFKCGRGACAEYTFSPSGEVKLVPLPPTDEEMWTWARDGFVELVACGSDWCAYKYRDEVNQRMAVGKTALDALRALRRQVGT